MRGKEANLKKRKRDNRDSSPLDRDIGKNLKDSEFAAVFYKEMAKIPIPMRLAIFHRLRSAQILKREIFKMGTNNGKVAKASGRKWCRDIIWSDKFRCWTVRFPEAPNVFCLLHEVMRKELKYQWDYCPVCGAKRPT